MIPTFLSKWFEKTPDELLAKNVREAADAYSTAVREAKSAGLSVTAYVEYPGLYSGNREYLSDKIFADITVYRNTSKTL